MNAGENWTAEQTALFLHLNAGTVRAMARRGELPATYLGGRWHFAEADVRTVLAHGSNRVASTHRRRRRRTA